MSVETGFIEYIFDTRGAGAVRREFDSISDAAHAGQKSFSDLEKVIAAVEGRAPRLAASLRRARTEMEAMARADKMRAQADQARPAMFKSAVDAGAAMEDRARRLRVQEIGKEGEARERLTRSLEDERRARAAIRQIGNPGDDLGKIEQLTRANGQLAVAIRGSERAQKDMAAATETSNRGIISQRYALYDIANIYGVLGTAMAGAGIYAAIVGAQFQAAFTNVERTLDPLGSTADSVDAVRQSLVQLQGQVPLTFAELSQIATIGNQMDIAEEHLMGFTTTIAKFSSVSGVSIEETSKAFGGFMAQTGLLPKYLENLGSSLALVSLKSNATEAEILAVSRQIATVSANSGMAADQVVGLASTFASLRIAPEAARGSMQIYFNSLRKAVAGGGDDLKNFATITSTTTEELTKMVRAGEGGAVLGKFLEGLNARDAIETTKALDALGLSQLRVDNSFTALSNNLERYNRQMGIAKEGFLSGAELNRQYAMTVDDLSSQWTILVNGLNSLIATVTGGAVEGLAGLLTMVNRLIYAFQEWLVNNPWARYLILITGAIITVVGVMALFQMVTLRARAALLAFQIANLQASAAGIQHTGTLRSLIGGLLGVSGAATAGARALRIFRAALVTTGVGALVVGAGYLADKLMGTANGADDATLSLKQYDKIAKDAKGSSGGAAEGVGGLSDALGGGGGGGGLSGAAEDASKKLRTLVDYANDLSGVFNRSFELRFGGEDAMDSITTRWNTMTEEIRKYEAEVRSLTADRRLKEYWLSIAEMYDDQLRAGVLREDLAKIDDKLAEANAGASKELKGNSQAAIDNRKEMRELSKGYQDYILQLARSGASQQVIDAEITRLNRQFSDQARQLGFNTEEVKRYTASFSDIRAIVSEVPRDITLGFNADPAKQALSEFFAGVEESAKTAGSGAGDALGGGIGDALGGLEMPDGLYDDLLEETSSAADEIGFTWSGLWWNIGHTAVSAIAEIAGQMNGLSEGVKAALTGGDFFAAFDSGAAEAEVLIREKFGALGFMGAEAMGAEFKRGSKPGEWIADGVTYAWDPIAREMSRVGAMSAEEYNASLGEGILPGPIIVDGINWAKDPITGEIYKVGAESSASWNSALLEGLDPNIIANKIKEGTPLSNTEARTLAESMGLEYNTVLNSSADPIGKILNKIQMGKDLTAKEARTLADADAKSYNSKFGLSLDVGGVVGSEFSGIDSTKARDAGKKSGNWFTDGVKSVLGGLGDWISDLFNPKASIGSRSGGKNGRGYSGGGYTGAGHWLEPAGVVHRGEYVVPKRHVNQRTGLPDMGYMNSLRNSKAAPKTGYATGGFVGGGMGGGTVDLSAASIQALARVVKNQVILDAKLIGDAANKSYVGASMIGAS